ncbi:hypothetical protein ACS0TY_025201 [Phlomoides rotata]
METNQKASINTSSSLSATAHGGDTPKEKDPGKPTATKRKGCPSVDDKSESLIKKNKSPLISCYSFTFDTNICGGSGGFPKSPESTPKFGSFNLVQTGLVKTQEDAEEEGSK